MYSTEIKELCNTISPIKLSVSRVPAVISLRNLLLDNTNFLDIELKVKIPLALRFYCVANNIKIAPKCKCCNTPAIFKRDDPKLGFAIYCSSKCSRSDKRISNDVELLLKDKDWLYNQRIILKKSKELIAKELGISVSPINKWILFHKIPNIKYNCSNPNVILKLEDSDWLFNEHKTNHRTCEDIGIEIGTSKSMVSIWLAKHGIEANESNSYDREVNPSGECLEIYDYIKTIYDGNIILDCRSIISGLELDIYIPDLNLAIEYNGLYSHIYRPEESSFSGKKGPKYHLEKTERCNAKNIQLLHIFSDSWKSKKDVWKNFIKNKILKADNRIFARKCYISKIDIHTKNTFLNDNHIQGSDRSQFKYGLFHDTILVDVMTFSIARYSKKCHWELMRFAVKSNYIIVGGFSKLLSHFSNSNPGSIISYADRTYSNGNVYMRNGFILDCINGPNYYYVKKNTELRLHRSNFKKSKISNIDDIRTEFEIMSEMEYSKIFDCGTLAFILK